MTRQHHYTITTRWTGNLGSGTLDYRAYKRNHEITAADKRTTIEASSDPLFRGDKTRYNPEELFVSSISSCHMLWYLHLAAVNDIIVLEYEDHAEGIMQEQEDGSGSFTSITLKPVIKIAKPTTQDEQAGGATQVQRAIDLHAEAHRKCFIANSVNVPITHEPQVSQA
jgi:organic hydroperoxide reductase OsmC/OhrA